jgi:dolichol-phosphate mannosyltransferase
MNILVVLPTFNESANIEEVLRRIRWSLPSGRVLVVDDGSPDGTADIAERIGEELDNIEVMRRSEKSGLGSAYRAGFLWGLSHGFDVFIEMDADLSHEPEALPRLVAPLRKGSGMVVGSRYVSGASIPDWTLSRRLLSRWGNAYSSLVLGLRISDSTSGFRAYSRSVLERIDLDQIRAEGYGFQIEMAYRALQSGAEIVEVPIRFVDRLRGQSKMSALIVIEALGLVTKWGLQRLAANYRSELSPVRI